MFATIKAVSAINAKKRIEQGRSVISPPSPERPLIQSDVGREFYCDDGVRHRVTMVQTRPFGYSEVFDGNTFSLMADATLVEHLDKAREDARPCQQ